MTYQIANWNTHFENDRSRQRDKCSFVCVPNKQHGMGFCRVMSEPDGAMIYGIWHLILGACSQQSLPRNGWLTVGGDQAGSAWGVDDLALKFRRPKDEIVRAMEVLSSEKVGWIICHKSPCGNNGLTADSPQTHLERKKEGKEENGVESPLQTIRERTGRMYGRLPTDAWSYEEEHALASVSKRENWNEEIALIECWRNAMLPEERKFFPQSLAKLMGNWTEHLDKARTQKIPQKPKTPKFRPSGNF